MDASRNAHVSAEKPMSSIPRWLPESLRPVWKFAYDYIYWYREIWWAIAFVLLVASGFLLYPYLPLILGDDSLPVRQKTYNAEISAGTMLSRSAVEVGAPEFTSPGRTVRLTYLISGDVRPSTDIRVRVVVGSNGEPLRAELSESKEFTYPQDAASTYGEYSFVLADEVTSSQLDIWTEVRLITPGEENAVTVSPIVIPVLKWPSYVAQLVTFLTLFGLFSVKNIGTALVRLWRMISGRPTT